VIAKHVRIGQPKAGRFGRLVQYLLDPQEKLARVGKLTVTNCYSDDPERAVLEVMNTQAQNVRAKSDKSYHLVVSFAPGENLSEETLAAIEKALVDGLGYTEHQRVSVVHHDTDCLHMHVAINKIHPRRHTIHEPIRDYYTLGTLCTQLETIHGLQVTNHQSQAQRLQQGAAEMETRSQRTSLAGWIRRECAQKLTATSTWEEWHRVMAQSGLTTLKRANGLVLESDAGVRVKASSIDRAFSYAALEKRLGSFEAAQGPTVPRQRHYVPQPLQSGSTALYARYQRERALHADIMRLHHRRLAAAKRSAIASILERHSLSRRALRALPQSFGKQLLYQQIGRSYRRRLDAVHAQARQAQLLISQTHGSRVWADWLIAAAAKGDVDALKALRARQRASAYQNSLMAAAGSVPPKSIAAPRFSAPTKRGTVPLAFGIRDHGRCVSIQGNKDARAYAQLLGLAATRFGSRLRAEGDERFRTHIVVAAAVTGAPITFEDPALEVRRQTLVTLMETLNERKRHDGRATDRGGARAAATAFKPRGPGLPRRSFSLAGGLPLPGSRADVGGLGGSSTPETLHRMRNLSDVPVVGHAVGPQVLLPPDAHLELGQHGAAPTDSLRRPVPAEPVKAPAGTGWVQADQYIAERMEKSLLLSDISKHERHEKSGLFPFAGLRTVNGQSLVLLKQEGAIGVMPVSEYAARRLKTLPLDRPVEVTRKGIRVGRRQ
jgi:Relaxase/Mobilisation nuclease domain/Large polyvalent protein-associated domain 7